MLVYVTSKSYPADTADKIYSFNIAKSLTKILKKNFLFVVANNYSKELEEVNYLNLKLKINRFKSVYYFFWLPYFVFSMRKEQVTFFTNDRYILLALIFWKKFTLVPRYNICSDWHMASNNRIDKFIMNNSDKAIVTSEKLKRKILNISKADEDRVLAVYGGINLENYRNISSGEARGALNLPTNKKIISYVGFFKTMGMRKGLGTMIAALAQLDTEDIIMLFVGGTEKEINEYKNFAESKGVLDRCIFIGRKSAEEVAIYQRASDVLVIPYPNEPHFREHGFPMKVYEYMASGRPIIYSKLDLVEEVIGDCGFGFEADSYLDLAKVISRVLSRPEEAEASSKLALLKVKNYTWDAKAERIIKFLEI